MLEMPQTREELLTIIREDYDLVDDLSFDLGHLENNLDDMDVFDIIGDLESRFDLVFPDELNPFDDDFDLNFGQLLDQLLETMELES